LEEVKEGQLTVTFRDKIVVIAPELTGNFALLAMTRTIAGFGARLTEQLAEKGIEL
jgi:hypothetical protein